MPTPEQMLGTGAVTIGPLVLVVQEMPIEAEVGLRAKLRALAREQLGPGSLMANVMPVVKWLREQKEHGDAARIVEIVAPMLAMRAGVSEDAAELYRQSPDGVAWELFYRTRKTHPDATREEFRAVINEVNALEVHIAILDAIAPKARTDGETTPKS